MNDLDHVGAHSIAGDKPSPTSRKSAAKRTAIVRAAIEIINTKSYALATMTEIAAALDLRDGTLYYYFPSKQALAYECHVTSLQRFERLLRDADVAHVPGSDKLRDFIRGFLADADENGPQLYFGDYSYLEAGQRAEITSWADRLTLMLEQFLKDGIADGSIVACETQLVVQLFLGMLIWLAKWVPGVEHLTSERLMEAITTCSLNGLDNLGRQIAKPKPRPAGARRRAAKAGIP